MGALTKDSIDPFTQVYDKILECLKASDKLGNLVRLPNYIEYQNDTLNQRTSRPRTDADTPELEMVHDNGNPFLHASSSQAKVTHTLALGILTNNLRAQKVYNPVKWYALLAIGKFADDNFGLQFVTKTEINNYIDRIDLTNEISGKITGWKGLLTIEVDIWFDRSLFS